MYFEEPIRTGTTEKIIKVPVLGVITLILDGFWWWRGWVFVEDKRFLEIPYDSYLTLIPPPHRSGDRYMPSGWHSDIENNLTPLQMLETSWIKKKKKRNTWKHLIHICSSILFVCLFLFRNGRFIVILYTFAQRKILKRTARSITVIIIIIIVVVYKYACVYTCWHSTTRWRKPLW